MKNQFTSRQQLLKQALKKNGLTALLVLGHENIRYLSGFSGNAAYALITAEESVLITDYRYFGRAQEESIGFEVVSRDRDSETLGQCINRFLTTNSQLGFDAAFIDVGYERDAFLHYLDLGQRYNQFSSYVKSTISGKNHKWSFL